MGSWLKDYGPRLIVGLLMLVGITALALHFVGIPILQISKSGIGDFDGQILYSRSMKQPIEVLPKQEVKEVFIMDLKSGRQRQVTDHRSASVRPVFSNIGPWIVYTSYVFHKKEKIRNADLFLYNLMTRERKLLSYKRGLNLAGSFDVKGRNVYFTIKQGKVLDIFRIGLDGKDFSRVTHGKRMRTLTKKGKTLKGRVHSSEPAISPDGTRMAFVSDRDGRPTLYIRDLKSKEDTRILFAGKYNTHPRWSPNGEQLVFQGYLKGHFDLFIVHSTGKNLRKITRAKSPSGIWANNESPDFSPDGKQIIFTSDRTGYNQLYIIDSTGRNVRRLTYDTFHYYDPQWSDAVLPTDGK
ncbi:MAG: PD40 domain-containing protein [Bdellovibrionaceae bacterium]|nr:PD40 domain-containing protein [Bdellovibrionales bacterium]MCB9084723.1 PD40 domain-containing protein [Pseudobdellovibrionaceae bacterium]